MTLPSPDKEKAANIYGVETKDLDYSDETQGFVSTKTYHGVYILGKDNNVIGRIRSWSVDVYGRNVQQVYELNKDTWGRPVDLVPGINSSGYTIQVERAEVWGSELERDMAGAEDIWADLIDQTKPFTIYEVLYKGSQPYIGWKYVGCWFSQKSDQGYTSDGDGIISVSGTINFVRRIKIADNSKGKIKSDLVAKPGDQV